MGSCWSIAPWNYPYMTAINTVAPALIAGNAVVLKHATQTLLVGERLVRAFTEAGVPADVFQNLFLDHETTSAMIAGGHLRFRELHRFRRRRSRDGTRGGWAPSRRLRRNSAAKTPAMSATTPTWMRPWIRLIDGAMFNSGQCCCGIERIYVHESLFDGFVEKAVAIVRPTSWAIRWTRQQRSVPWPILRFADLVRSQTADAISRGRHRSHRCHRFADDGGDVPVHRRFSPT